MHTGLGLECDTSCVTRAVSCIAWPFMLQCSFLLPLQWCFVLKVGLLEPQPMLTLQTFKTGRQLCRMTLQTVQHKPQAHCLQQAALHHLTRHANFAAVAPPTHTQHSTLRAPRLNLTPHMLHCVASARHLKISMTFQYDACWCWLRK